MRRVQSRSRCSGVTAQVGGPIKPGSTLRNVSTWITPRQATNAAKASNVAGRMGSPWKSWMDWPTAGDVSSRFTSPQKLL